MSAHLLIPTQTESLPCLLTEVQSMASDCLNPFEVEIVSKLDIIVAVLRTLEEQFLQTRQEVLKKSSLEGKEGGKIFAVKGRVILNKKKYYRSLEGNIELLTKNLQNQLDKVFLEFKSLKSIAGFDEKHESDIKIPQEPIRTNVPIVFAEVPHSEIPLTSPCIKSIALPSIKRIESAKKSVTTNTNRLLPRQLTKASSATHIELPKRTELDRPESIPNPQVFKPQRDSLTVQSNILSLPSLPEVPETEEVQQTVSRVRLGLLHETQGDMGTKAPRHGRPIRGHGFRLSPPAGFHQEKKTEGSPGTSIESQPEPHTLG